MGETVRSVRSPFSKPTTTFCRRSAIADKFGPNLKSVFNWPKIRRFYGKFVPGKWNCPWGHVYIRTASHISSKSHIWNSFHGTYVRCSKSSIGNVSCYEWRHRGGHTSPVFKRRWCLMACDLIQPPCIRCSTQRRCLIYSLFMHNFARFRRKKRDSSSLAACLWKGHRCYVLLLLMENFLWRECISRRTICSYLYTAVSGGQFLWISAVSSTVAETDGNIGIGSKSPILIQWYR